jgi:hypothetical protein
VPDYIVVCSEAATVDRRPTYDQRDVGPLRP